MINSSVRKLISYATAATCRAEHARQIAAKTPATWFESKFLKTNSSCDSTAVDGASSQSPSAEHFSRVSAAILRFLPLLPAVPLHLLRSNHRSPRASTLPFVQVADFAKLLGYLKIGRAHV